MWALGDKIASTILAQSAGVPTVPWSGSRKFGLIQATQSMIFKLSVGQLHEGIGLCHEGLVFEPNCR